MAADLNELEDKLLELFNAKHSKGVSAYGDSGDSALNAIAAVEAADMILRLRQQKHMEDGNPHLVPQNNPRAIRHYRQKTKK